MPAPDLAIPILPSRSLAATAAFYRQLGFDGDVHEHGGYAVLTRGSLELHFAAHAELDPAASYAMCYLRVGDVDALHRAFAAAKLPQRGIPRLEPVADRPWGMREFALVDPDGSLLRVGQTV